MSERYITDRFLPDKAIDLIDEACSRLNLDSPQPSGDSWSCRTSLSACRHSLTS